MTKPILKNKNTAAAAAILCTLLWGTAFPFIKLGYSAFEISDSDIGTKLLFAGARFSLAGIMVFIISLIMNRKFPLLKRRDLIPVSALGLVQTSAQYIFTYIGIGFTSGANTSIITACASFFTVLFSPLFFKKDKLGALKIVGCILGFCGVLAINTGGGINADTLFGDFMILLSTVSASAGNIISKKAAESRDAVTVTAYQLFIGGIVLAIFGIVTGGSLKFSDIGCIAILLWLAFVSAAAFSIWTALLKYHPASKISVFNLLVPVFGTMLSGVLLGEDVFGISTLISLLLISAGIIAVNISGNLNAKDKLK